jgi:PPOX class probable F420-dependent enzyme
MGTALDDARYISLMSFKRDGNGVATPVWVAPLDGKLVMYTRNDSYKVKRIRRNASVRVARCDVRGKLLGPWMEGTCTVVEDSARQASVMDALRCKYGWQMRALDFFARVGGTTGKRAYLEVTLSVGAT